MVKACPPETWLEDRSRREKEAETLFTGLIEGVCRVEWIRPQGRGRDLSVRLGPLAEGLRVGDSVSLSGACSTVVRLSGPSVLFHLGEETLQRTWFSQGLVPGKALNVERALKVGDRLGGHLVQGHVDGTARLVRWDRSAGEGVFAVRVPRPLLRFLAEKGSLALDGVSLTVAALQDDLVEVALIPHTAESTTLGKARPGDLLNLEVDLLARYLDRLRSNPE